MKFTDLSSETILRASQGAPLTAKLDAETRLNLLIESATDYGFILLDTEGNVEGYNPHTNSAQSFSQEDIIGSHLSQFYLSVDIENKVPQKHLERAKEFGRIEEDIAMVRKDGSSFFTKVIITSLKNDLGFLIGFSLIIRDQSKFKEIAERLHYGEALASHKIFDGIKDYAVFTLDLEGVIQSWNEGARRIHGFESKEVIGKHFSIILPVESPLDKSKYEIEETLNTGRYVEEGWRTRKDGSLFWANIVISTVKNNDHKIIGFIKVTRDMTDRKRSEDLLKMAYKDLEKKIDQRTNELMTSNIKLQEAIQIRDEFLSIASHELKTPLTPLKMQTQIIRKRVNEGTFKDLDDTKIHKIINVLESSVNRLTDLIENLLDVSRINLERMVIRKEEINLKIVFERLFERYKSSIEMNKTKVYLSIEEDIVGHFDELRIEQVFLNLLMNALKYGEQKPIEINVKKVDYCVLIEFRDQGTGIAEDYHQKIFQRYERLDIHKNVSGLGLGLYITKEIIEAHEGSITVESQLGKGSIFRIQLPLSN